MDKLIKLLVLLAVVGLGYVTYESVAKPLRFDKVEIKRAEGLQKQLKKLVTFEEAYESVHGAFATEEQLRDFLLNGSIYYVNAEGDYTDSMREQGLTEAAAAAKGLIKRDTIWVKALDSLLKGDSNLDPLFTVNGTNNKVNIEIGTIEQEVGRDTIHQPVFQITIPYEAYLADQDPKLVQERVDRAKERTNGYPGLRIGSLSEVKKTGNWE